MKSLYIETAIPDTPEAKAAINVALRKIWTAHGAQGYEYYKETEIKNQESAGKSGDASQSGSTTSGKDSDGAKPKPKASGKAKSSPKPKATDSSDSES